MNVHDATNAIRAFLSSSSSTTTILLAVMYVTRLGAENEAGQVRARAMVATTTAHDRITGATQTEADFWIDVDTHTVVAWSRPSDAVASNEVSAASSRIDDQDDDDGMYGEVAPYRRGRVALSGAAAAKNETGDHHTNSLERLTRAYQAGIDLASTLAMSSATSGNRVVSAAVAATDGGLRGG